MKKYFMYVAFAAAGLLTSCSSESLTAGDDPQNPNSEDRVLIEIGVASPQAEVQTRGLGTVGDLSTGTNIWRGEKINVFMFEKGTLTLAEDGNSNPLYNNTILTTPATASNTNSDLAYEYYTQSATDDRVRYKYYPLKNNTSSGLFDFWGYYRDDALPTAPASSDPVIGASEVTVPFVIDGSQDLMVAKAEPTTADLTTISAWPVANQNNYYSSYAARNGVQPNLTFKHLLTRLTFSVVGGNDDACGFTSPDNLPADGTVYSGVFVRSITIKSKFTGNIIAAYTGGARTVDQLISFDNTVGTNSDGYAKLELKGARTADATPVANLYSNDFDWGTESTIQNLLKIDESTHTINTHWSEIQRPQSTSTPSPVGGALLVSPEDQYEMEISLGQFLLDSEDVPVGSGGHPTYKVVYSSMTRTISPVSPATTFAQGTSYNVNIKLYGLERIEITTTLEPWVPGGNIDIEGD